MLVLFVIATACFVRSNSTFGGDDLTHFIDARTKTLWDMMRTPIDVHFAPLHQLASFIVFKFYGFNFDVIVVVESVGWVAIIALTHQLIQRLVSYLLANILTLLFGTSPLWFHTLIWWSASAHRLPYLFLQACGFFMYLRYREQEKTRDAVGCVLIQMLALGFFIKSILFPAELVAFELCLAALRGRLSRPGLKVCVAMGAISLLYVGWYFILAPIDHSDIHAGVLPTLYWAVIYVSRLGSLLLFLPLDQTWASCVSVAIWVMLIGWRIYVRPVNAFSITALLLLLTINFSMSIFGRGIFATFPFSSLRYYPDVIVTVVVFFALTFASTKPTPVKNEESSRTVLFSVSLLALVIVYPVTSYFSNHYLFQKVYTDSKKSHKYVSNVQAALSNLSTHSHPKVLQADFPPFIFGFMGARMPLENVFGILYPRIEWVPVNQAKSGINAVQNDGHVVPLVLPEINP